MTYVLGALALGHATALSIPNGINVAWLLLALITINLGTRVGLKIPHVGGRVEIADGLVVFALFVFGGEPGVLLAAVAALCTALRRHRSASRLMFDVAANTVAAWLIVWVIRACFGPISALAGTPSSLPFVGAVCLVSVLFAFAQTLYALSEAGEAVRRRRAARPHARFAAYGWTVLTYFAVVSLAGLAARTVGLFGFYPAAVVASVAALLHYAYDVWPQIIAPAQRAAAVERGVASLRESEELFRSAFDYAAIGMALVSAEGRWLQVNRSLCDILGYTEEELLDSEFQQVTHPDDLGTALANIKELVKGKVPTYQMEKRYLHKQGHAVWSLWSVSSVRDPHTNAVHLIFQIQDITDRKRAEGRLLHDAFHDALTGLPNRALFIDHLQLAIARTKRSVEQMFAVLFLDLDRFKVINDSLGHMIGDQLLVGVARRLESCLRPGDTVARVGGDEFTILLEAITEDSEAVAVAERIQREIGQALSLEGREVFTTVSIGIALSSIEYVQPEDVLRDADTAMYCAKSLGKARHEVFDKQMHAVAINLLQMETDMRRALDRHEFFMQYQPIVALDTFELRGFEALVRWQHPERGLISPLDFIPVAEDTGQILAIGHWVLKDACRQMRRWQRRFPSDPPLSISVNLSGRQFTQPDLIEQVKLILAETKLEARCLKLEITESVVMENIDTATEMLRQLRELGVQLSIDDFGTGYSSLSYLHRFPINTLKIDRSFVTCMVNNNENIEIVRTIVMLAQNLGMDVVAEGVETKEQLALLRKLGCENGQGYFFSRPSDVTGAEKIIFDTYPSGGGGGIMSSKEIKPLRPALIA